MRLLEYAEKIKDIDFSHQGINEIDITMLTEIGYLPLDDIIPSDMNDKVNIKKIYKKYSIISESMSKNWVLATKQRFQLLKIMAFSKRYKNLLSYNYQTEIDISKEVQFTAMIFEIANIIKLVVFRGTDDTLIGWKEDFNMSYKNSLPSQELAYKYLENILNYDDKEVTLSGHSKGGNLAIYSATMLSDEYTSRIKKIYVFDSPWLREEMLSHKGYIKIKPKIKSYCPEQSVVGVLFKKDIRSSIIKSDGFDLLQHYIFLWHIEGNYFVRLKNISQSSKNISKTVQEWMSKQSNENLKLFFDTLFDLLFDVGISTIPDLTDNPLAYVPDIIKQATLLDDDKKEVLKAMSKELLDIWKSVKTEEYEKSDLYHIQYNIHQKVSQAISDIGDKISKK